MLAYSAKQTPQGYIQNTGLLYAQLLFKIARAGHLTQCTPGFKKKNVFPSPPFGYCSSTGITLSRTRIESFKPIFKAGRFIP